MANEERKKELDCDFVTVQKRNTMKREKPQQQIYRPGSGPLRKSNIGIEESESDTNLIINSSRSTQSKNLMPNDDSKFRSEGSSPRNVVTDFDSATSRLGDMSIGKDAPRKQKKPEQTFYVPKPVQMAKLNDSQEFDHNFYAQTNGNDGRGGKRYNNKRSDYQPDRWRVKSPGNLRNVRQGSEPRGLPNGNNWQRSQRDTRSVEPSTMPNRNYNPEKIQSKPPSGRRHSTIGLESDKQHKKNWENLPPRLRKKFMDEKHISTPPAVDEHWDGTSLTFQGTSNPPTDFIKNPSYHQMPNYSANTLPSAQPGYFTLPNRPRGRGRLQQEYDQPPPQPGYYRSMTPERLRNSPCNSRPATPPPRNDSRPQTPVNYGRNTNKREQDQQHRYDSAGVRDRPDDGRRNYRRGDYNQRRDDGRRNDRGNRREYNRHNVNRRDSNANPRRDNEGGPRWDRHENGVAANRPSQVSHRGFRESLEAQLSPVSPESPPETSKPISIVPVFDTALDWSEEVELNYRLENEALSDDLTRSSSVTSLTEVTTKSMPATLGASTTNAKKTKRRNRRRSKQRGDSASRDTSLTRSRQNSIDNTGIEFKIPQDVRGRRCRHSSRDKRESSYERYHNKSRNSSRDCSFDRNRNNSTSEHENWREEIRRSRQNSEQDGGNFRRSRNNSEVEVDVKKAGVIVLPTKPTMGDHPRYPEVKKSIMGVGQQKSLFDPNNPRKPIVVKTQSTRVPVYTEPNQQAPEQLGSGYPYWYDEKSDEFKSCKYPNLLRDVKKADAELQQIISSGYLLVNSEHVDILRQFLKQALEYLLCKALKFSQAGNVEQHFWKILYYNIIEVTRKDIANDPDNKEQYKGFLLYLIDEGMKYFEGLLVRLEETFDFKLNDYLGNNTAMPSKGLGFVGLALVSAQKLFLFLGDLGRYREQVNESSNYGKCRQWYIKSHEINPKNGKPYNQLALLAVYARRKLDAVYYYMRSLMSSNPVPSARESLISLFDENRKKYEQGEKKRREERLERARQQMKQKESENSGTVPGSLRKETWIHPEGGRRVHRTTQSVQDQKDSEEEDLAALSSVEVNKRFVISYLHVHGKLITNIGMESFYEASMQMLKEFRALLQHSPVPLPCNRFLQLLALNMFAIDSTQLKDPQFQSQTGYRSELQERALVVSLQMFNLILERCVSILQEHLSIPRSNVNSLPQDANVLLPAIKIWCDWMLCHSCVWNPPPSTQDFKVGASGDAWSRLAVLMNLLEQMDQSASEVFVNEQRDGYELVRLPEDSVLCGFTPLIINIQKPTYAPKDLDIELAQFTLRLDKLIFFGTVFLCGLEPPVLKLEMDEDEIPKYVSVVCTSNSRDSPPSPQELAGSNDVLLESFSGDEDVEPLENFNVDASSETRDLLNRKVELERRHRNQEKHLQQVKKILSLSVVSVHIEVRPRHLVPDTNCFIDHLDRITSLASSHCYSLMVPIVVLSELEGLARGGKSPMPAPRSFLDPQHVRKVGESAKKALEFLKARHQAVKCVTTKGTVLTSTAFTIEDDSSLDANLKNDDKILTTCLALCKGHKEQPTVEEETSAPRYLIREVVLLTEDRNLRVKAHARDVPVRELPDFMRWAGLG